MIYRVDYYDIVNEELVGMVVDKFFEHWRGINYIDTDLHSVVLSLLL